MHRSQLWANRYLSNSWKRGGLSISSASRTRRPALRVADCTYNAERILGLLDKAERESVALVVFPELSLTGYTCADLFQQTTLQKEALAALAQVARAGASAYSGIAVVGLPLAVD